MSVLGKRILRLEGRTSPRLPPVAVVAASLPAVMTDEWAADLLARHGWTGLDLAVSVQNGEPALLLAPMPFAWIKGDAERIWLGTLEDYPHALIMSGPGGLLAERFENEIGLRRWMLWLEGEIAA